MKSSTKYIVVSENKSSNNSYDFRKTADTGKA